MSESPTSGVTSEARSSAPLIRHPILAVEGKGALLSEVINARIPGDNAFSASTRSALQQACFFAVDVTETGAPIVGPASFVRACLKETRPDSKPAAPSTLADAIAAYVLEQYSGDQTVGQRLRSLPTPTDHVEKSELALVDEHTTKMLAEAARLVRTLDSAETRVDVTHALLCALATPQGQRAFFDLQVVKEPRDLFFDALFDVSLVYARAHLSASLALPLKLEDGAAPAGPPSRSDSTYVADKPAEQLADDKLGVADEARALAEVICLTDPGPPLAIGLFGDWGSGKSTFMNMIEAAIDELTKKTATEAKDATVKQTFVSKVVHIKFNAWTYNDASLWASLTSEFFAQLQAGGWNKTSQASYDDIVKDVFTEVAKREGQLAQAGAVARDARQQVAALGAELEALQAKRRSEPLVDAGEAFDTIIESVATPQDLENLATALRDLGYPITTEVTGPKRTAALRAALRDSKKELQEKIESAVHLRGRIWAFGRAFWSGLRRLDFRMVVPTVVFALTLVALAILRHVDLDGTRTAIARLIGLCGTLGPILILLKQAYDTVAPLLRTARAFQQRRRAAQVELDDRIALKKAALEGARKNVTTTIKALAENEANASRFRGGTPDQVYDYFLNASGVAKRFETDLGIVSRARRAFDQLNAIAAQRQKEGAAKVDRIVLYIDDLDRCRVEQVVKVLEAVHLLLAFPLFVVVVGVDARWLRQSLLEVYDRQLTSSRSEGTATKTATEIDHRATVQDYLDKIFQIPLHLRGVTTSEGGQFRTYLSTVVGTFVADPPRDPLRKDAPTPSDPTGTSVIHEIDVKAKPRTETAREVVERVMLHEHEVKVMNALAPLYGTNPRAVKRLVNVYRLIRGLRRGDALGEFLEARNGKAPTYPAVLFWLAIEIGRGAIVADAIDKALASATAGDVVAKLRTAADDDKSPLGTLAAEDYEACVAALAALQGTDAGVPAVDALRAVRVDTQRFTLHQR